MNRFRDFKQMRNMPRWANLAAGPVVTIKQEFALLLPNPCGGTTQYKLKPKFNVTLYKNADGSYRYEHR